MPPRKVYELLEPYLQDRRKLRLRVVRGFELTHMDSFIDELLLNKVCCDVTLPTITSRLALERSGIMEPRESPIAAEFEKIIRQEEIERRKKRAAGGVSDEGEPSAKRRKGDADSEGSVDYWNRIRQGLGLKPLR